MGKRIERKKALVEFIYWSEITLSEEIQRIEALMRVNAHGINNPMLQYVVPRAMNYVVEHSCLRVVEAWVLLNEEREAEGFKKFSIEDRDYKRLTRMRNKLIAHRVPNELTGRKHHKWYKRYFGSYESALSFIQKVALVIAKRIQRMQLKGQLPSQQQYFPRLVPRFNVAYVNEVLDVLRNNHLC